MLGFNYLETIDLNLITVIQTHRRKGQDINSLLYVWETFINKLSSIKSMEVHNIDQR